MGCDYYHEAILEGQNHVDDEDLSEEPGDIEFIARVYDDESNVVEENSMTFEIPVGGKLYLDRVTDEQIWAR